MWNWPSLLDDDDEWPLSVGRGSGLQVSEDDTHITVEAHLPGLSSETIDVTYQKGVLTIRGEQEEKEEDKKKKYYRRAQRSFNYQVAVPGNVDEEAEPEATYRDGVMTVRFAKRKQVQPKKITIKAA